MQRDLNDAFLRTLTAPASGQVTIRDGGHDGLALRITSKGTMSWSVRARKPDGERLLVTIGRYPAVKLAAARKAATAATAAVQAGRNPNAEKRRASAARKAAAIEPTVKDRAEAWLAARMASWRPSTYATAKGHMHRTVIPTLGKRVLRETTRADWVGMVEKKRTKHPGGAATLFRWVQAFLNDAEASGWIDEPLLPRNAAQRIAPQGPARERVLSEDELAAVWKATAHLSTRPRAFVRLLILSAGRRSEVAGIRLGEVDRDAGTWTLPAMRAKNGTSLAVPLAALAMAEVHAAWREGEGIDGTTFLFGKFSDAALSGFSKIKAALDKHLPADMPAWDFHDLRRTARTGMGKLGIPELAAEAALNHISARPAMSRVYDRHDYGAEAADALKAWQGRVAGLVGEGAEVIALRHRA